MPRTLRARAGASPVMAATRSGWGCAAAMLAAIAILVLVPFAGAQSTWQVDVLVPNVISVRVPSTQIGFALTLDDYPPNAFPARYPATSPTGGVLPVQVFSNATGPWTLQLQIPDLLGASGQGVVTADQVLYRVDGGAWQRASSLPQVIYTGNGPTGDWLEIDIEFEIELRGTESAGSFGVDAQLTATLGS